MTAPSRLDYDLLFIASMLAHSVNSDLLAPLFSTPEMRTAFSDGARIQSMLIFEAALARAEARSGAIPESAAEAVQLACDSFEPDVSDLAHATRSAGNLAIPLVKALTAHCAPEGRGYVHWGATSQDAIDTALVLQMRAALGLIDVDLARLGTALADQATAHRNSVMLGRTLLQPALPVTFGFKCAGWLDMVADSRASLARSGNKALRLQFGGAVGTLAALGDKAEAVRAALGRELGLPVPDMAWHASRAPLMRLAGELAILCGTLAKIAGDVALLMQGEVGEAFEPAAPGRGGSSTMAHKRNPVAALAVRASAQRAGGLVAGLLAGQAHEHERGAGGWHAEWEAMPELFGLTAGALRHTAETVEGLEVDADRMCANLDIGHGTAMAEALTMALATHIGRDAAYELVADLARRALEAGRALAEIAADEPKVAAHLDRAALDRALDPANYLGLAPTAVDIAVARWNSSMHHNKGET